MNWQILKQRPAQFGDNKHKPGVPREFWASVKKNKGLLEKLADDLTVKP